MADCRVSIDYHVQVEAHYYSVPHRFIRAEVEVRFTAGTVKIFHKGERIAAHQRMSGNHKHTTVPEHMASSRRRYAGGTIERIRKDAASIGPATAALCDLILDKRLRTVKLRPERWATSNRDALRFFRIVEITSEIGA